jgi:hypothetical protein
MGAVHRTEIAPLHRGLLYAALATNACVVVLWAVDDLAFVLYVLAVAAAPVTLLLLRRHPCWFRAGAGVFALFYLGVWFIFFGGGFFFAPAALLLGAAAALAAGTRRAPWSARITIAVVVILALLLL